MAIRGLMVLLLLGGIASAQPKKAPAGAPTKSDRYGIPLVDSHELVSNVAIVGLTGTPTQGLMRAIHAAEHAKEPLATDDQSPEAPVWMFGSPVTKVKAHTSAGDCSLRIEFLGFDGIGNDRLSEVVKPAHLVVLVLSGTETKDVIEAALKKIRGEVRPERIDQVVIWAEHDAPGPFSAPFISSSKAGPAGLLSAIVKTIASGKPPAPPAP